jgi:uncharacterized protein
MPPMGKRTSYEPGTFSWVDLATTDPDSAKSFYAGLLGWEFEDQPIPDGGGVYTMCRLDGDDVAAISSQRDEEKAAGVPPHWNNYVTVEDADASASRASELGGNLLLPAFDVMEVGRMAVTADPTGAPFCIWQPKAHIGAGPVNEPGTLCWNELSTNDLDRALAFYTSLFGWAPEHFDGQYTVIRVGDKSNGGVRPLGDLELQHGVPPNWMPYFAVDDSDQSAARAAELGGNVMAAPMDVPISDESRIAVVADPTGAAFGIFSGPLDP